MLRILKGTFAEAISYGFGGSGFGGYGGGYGDGGYGFGGYGNGAGIGADQENGFVCLSNTGFSNV